MAMLKADLEANVACHGAWVEHKDLLVAWHYREVEKSLKTTLMAKAKEIYSKHDFKVLPISKRFENEPPMGWDRGDSCIHILKWIFGLDWEERVKVCKICIRTGRHSLEIRGSCLMKCSSEMLQNLPYYTFGIQKPM